MSENPTQIIERRLEELGPRVTVMGHHYQNDRVIRHCGEVGDSLELARKVPGLTSEHIVFCGVSFMAETARVLAQDCQKVTAPAPDAGCVMSGMAPWALLDAVLRRLNAQGRTVTPLAYVNTEASVKAVVARHGGGVCTSANAPRMLSWALERGQGVLFLPDANLGMNTADKLGLRPEVRVRLDVRDHGCRVEPDALADKELLLWPGLCAVHHRFKKSHIDEVRRRDPDALVVVHPECHPEVVAAADADGSTSFIIDYVAKAPEGAAIYVGTEISLVERLAKRWQGRKMIRPLTPSMCSSMAMTTEAKLAELLTDLDAAPAVTVPADVARDAKIAIQRMLDVCA
ncbi:quinolinate synthase NadA [Desulfocurvus sp. DL9XJH121]